jgi:ribosomal protein L24
MRTKYEKYDTVTMLTGIHKGEAGMVVKIFSINGNNEYEVEITGVGRGVFEENEIKKEEVVPARFY